MHLERQCIRLYDSSSSSHPTCGGISSGVRPDSPDHACIDHVGISLDLNAHVRAHVPCANQPKMTRPLPPPTNVAFAIWVARAPLGGYVPTAPNRRVRDRE